MIDTSSESEAPLKIFQLNLNRSQDAQEILLGSIGNEYDILLLQEPYIDGLENTRASHHWNVLYPSTKPNDNHERIRSVILVNTRIKWDTIQQIQFDSSDVTVVKISLDIHSAILYNIYNDCTHNRTLERLSQHMAIDLPQHITSDNNHFFLFGDFNHHHPLWESPQNAHLNSSNEDITPLLDIIMYHGLEMMLPCDIPTLESLATGNWTRTDNAWRSPNDLNPMILCDVVSKQRPEKTDHLLIVTTLQFPITRTPAKLYRSYRAVDWDNYRDELQTRLPPLPEVDSLMTQESIDDAVQTLTEAIQATTEATVPFTKPILTTKRWWTPELTALRKARNRLSREHFRWRGAPDHPSHSEYREQADDFVKQVRAKQEEHWTEWLAGITSTDLWDANKFISRPASDFSKQHIPPLKDANDQPASSNDLKSQLLAAAFFPPPPTSPIIPHSAPCQPVDSFEQYSPNHILDAINATKPNKAPGPDGIPNIVLSKCADILTDQLLPIYEAIFVYNIYPSKWRESTTIVLRKPGKSDYTSANAYRPIALLNTMAKVLSAMVAADLTYLSEHYRLLPANQFGGRPGRSTTEALHLLTQTIKTAWRAHDVVSVLFLDIKAAFPNVVMPVLLNNMKQRGIPDEYIEFTRVMLTGQITKLSFDDFISSDIAITNGNGQGCPLSMIYYSFYIAPLLESSKNNKQESAIIFVDDTSLIACGKTFEETHLILKDMMERDNGCLNWSLTHNSQFELGKLAVMDFTHSQEKKATSTDLVITHTNLNGTISTSTIKQTNVYKLLGVRLDPKLNFHHHHDLVLARAVQWPALFRCINRMTKGLSLKFTRQLYLAVAVPRITYAADVWYTPPHRRDGATRQSGKVGLTRKLDSIQRMASIAIMGAMNGVAADAAAVHANIFSTRLTLLDACHRAIVRLATRPKDHPLHPYIQRAARGPVQAHNTTLHTLFGLTDIDPQTSEKIPATFMHPNFTPLFETNIPANREAALEWDSEHQKDECMIYTDGSGYNGGIGASAILYQDGVRKASLKHHLGTDEEHTVYEGELVGILLGLHLIERTATDADQINFSLDNQASIQAIHHKKPQPSHHLLEAIHKARKSAHDENRYPKPATLMLTWVPGHEGVKGNEAADALAKEAAEGASSPANHLPPLLRSNLPLSSSATKQYLHQRVKDDQRITWAKSKRHNRLKDIDPSLPSGQYLRLTADLTHAQTSLLTQLRTNHIPLNAHLHRIKRADNPVCTACFEADEDIHHFLFVCPAYRSARLKLERALKRSSSNLETLLADKEGIQHLLCYVRETKRFKHLSKSLDIDPKKC